MGRITKVTGEFMGVRFEVKPTPIRFDKVMDERRNLLLGWYKKNHPTLHEKIESDDYDVQDYTLEELNAINAWRLDKKFRAKYCKYTAEKCIKLDKELEDSTWESDDLELGTLEEAWDFFTNRRQVPSNGVGLL